MMTQPNTAQEYSVHPATKMGHVALTVANLENQILFYEKAIGLKLHWREGNKAGLGAGGADLLQLTEEPNLKRYRGGTGLYHFAILFPNRRELAIVMARLFALKIPNSPTDHVMTKTTYLSDPEGNGIELYCESPEDGSWTIKDGNYEARWADGRWSDGREALDVDALDEVDDGSVHRLAPLTERLQKPMQQRQQLIRQSEQLDHCDAQRHQRHQ